VPSSSTKTIRDSSMVAEVSYAGDTAELLATGEGQPVMISANAANRQNIIILYAFIQNSWKAVNEVHVKIWHSFFNKKIFVYRKKTNS
jgi:hypothetical protein